MSELIEIWKKCRDTVEHFDKILGDFRKISFAFNAALVAVTYQVFQNNEWPFYVMLIGIVWNLSNFLVWLAEKHYHLYLIEAASVAKKIENELNLTEETKLTTRLGLIKEKQFHISIPKLAKVYFYDLFYIFFCFIGLWLVSYQGRMMAIVFGVAELIAVTFVLRSQFLIEHKKVPQVPRGQFA
jgi:hypothetical protein